MNAACPMEAGVVRAAATNAWPHALRDHVQTCEECAAAAAVAPWMHSFAERDDRQHPLPDPMVLFLKAQLLKSTTTVDRAVRPIARFQMAAYFIVAAGWAALMMTKWNQIQTWLHGLTPGGMMEKVAGGAAAMSVSMSVIAALAILSSMTVVLALHSILAEE
jgi:hypothetical protein